MSARNILRPALRLSTEEKPTRDGDGSFSGNDDVVLSDELVEVLVDHRPVVSEQTVLSGMLVGLTGSKLLSDTLRFVEATAAYLNKAVSGGSRGDFVPAEGILTTRYGQGKYGQLGYGGTTNVTG
jgi:hypothetical protein